MKLIYIRPTDTVLLDGQSLRVEEAQTVQVPNEARQFDSDGNEIVMYIKLNEESK
jgi:hypothetical protein